MIPLHTTLVTYKSFKYASGGMRDPYGDGYGTDSDNDLEPDKTAADVRAVISVGSGTSGAPGDTEFLTYTLMSDVPASFVPTFKDVVIDQNSNQEFEIVTLLVDPGIAGFALDHIVATIRSTKGANVNHASP